jgi:hypothetical protein
MCNKSEREMSHRANDFIIKNGHLVRNFNKMYEQVGDAWDQAKVQGNDIHTTLALSALLFWSN